MESKIINYIKYLRDTSKYFVIPGNMYRSLSPASLKNNKETPYHIQSKHYTLNNDSLLIDQNTTKNFYNLIKSDKEKQMFLGIGYIAGKSKKKIFGNIFYLPVIFEDNLNITFNTSDILINLDLITSILPDYVSFEDIFENIQLLEIFQKIEEGIQTTESFDISKCHHIIDDLISQLNILYNELNITPFSEEFNYEEILKTKNHPLFAKKQLFYSSQDFFLFSNKIPSNISTWKALSNFVSYIENDEFEHNVLNYLFSNVFSKTSYLSRTDIDKNRIMKAIQNIPVELSEKQQAGLANCFEYPISYIQGPPGTGKSHTISGIILAAYILNKKVLVVSQKNTALNVVKNNIQSYFSEEAGVPFIYFEKDKKSSLKESLNYLLEKSKVNDFNYGMAKSNIEYKIQDISILNQNLDDTGNQINSILKEMNVFYENNKVFQKDRNTFFDNPVYEIGYHQKLTKLKEIPEVLLGKIWNIEKEFLLSKKLNQYKLFKIKQIESTLKEKFEINILLINYMKKGLAYKFLKNWFELNVQYKANQEQQNVSLSFKPLLINLRYNKDNCIVKLKDKTESLFKEVHHYNLQKSISSDIHYAEIDNFKKMLHWSKADTILDKMSNIDFEKITDVFPIWLSEIRNIGEILPLQKEMFDLIIVDEASQVNLAEILPVFYRGNHVCILGDHKQLGLNSVGVNFLLSKKSDALIWEKHLGNNLSYAEGKEKNLIITHSSILEMMISDHNYTSFPSIMLDEHWRCLPGLISFSNKKYYHNKLKMMTQTPKKMLSDYATGIKVDGQKNNKTNEVEANKVIEIIKYLTEDLTNQKNNQLYKEISLNNFIKEKQNKGTLSIGIISLLRDQVDLLNEMIDNQIPEDIRTKFDIFCGTTEEFQGEEKDIIIHSFVVDKNSRNSGHYSDEKRFNVAISRAKYYNIVVYTDVSNVPIYKEYLNHLNILQMDDETQDIFLKSQGWEFDYQLMESEFEAHVFDALLFELNKSENSHYLKYFNQVKTIGYRLDFVFYNINNNKSVAIEVDGRHHFEKGSQYYTTHHKERIDILKKAGWNIINTADYNWYHDGYFNLDNYKTKQEISRIIKEIKEQLDL